MMADSKKIMPRNENNQSHPVKNSFWQDKLRRKLVKMNKNKNKSEVGNKEKNSVQKNKKVCRTSKKYLYLLHGPVQYSLLIG